MDNKIIQEVLNGNTEKLSILIDKYYNELFVFVHNQVNNIPTTEDLLQEIFMKIHQKLHKFNPKKASFRTWMYRVSLNHCLDFHRKKKIYTISDFNIDTLASNHEDVLQDMINNDDVKEVITVMSKILSSRQYRVIMLKFFSNLSIDEIANSMNITPKTIRNIVSLSIKKIKDEMGGFINDGI